MARYTITISNRIDNAWKHVPVTALPDEHIDARNFNEVIRLAETAARQLAFQLEQQSDVQHDSDMNFALGYSAFTAASIDCAFSQRHPTNLIHITNLFYNESTQTRYLNTFDISVTRYY